MERPQGEQTPFRYWYERLCSDRNSLDPERKRLLIEAFLEERIGLSKEETETFMGEIPSNLQKFPEFIAVERKVGDFFNTGFSGREEEKPRIQKFLERYKSILEGFYTKKELEEMIGYLGLDEEILLVRWLVGKDHYLMRRIRNAYLPGMLDVIIIDPTKGGQEQILFDGDKDPVDQFEELMGDNN